MPVIFEHGMICLKIKKLFYFSAQRLFAAQANLTRLIDFQHLDHDLVAFLQYIRHLGNSFLGNLRNVQQAFRAG